MIRLTRIDHRMIWVNPDHIIHIEPHGANLDCTMLRVGHNENVGGLVVRELCDEVVGLIHADQERRRPVVISNSYWTTPPPTPPPSFSGGWQGPR